MNKTLTRRVTAIRPIKMEGDALGCLGSVQLVTHTLPTMRIPRRINNRLRTLAAALSLAWAGAMVLSAGEPYVHWAITVPGGVVDNAGVAGPLVVTGDGGLIDYENRRRFSPQGNLEWVNTNLFPGISLSEVKTDALGNQYCTGYTAPTNATDYYNFFLAKYGPTNNLLWIRKGEGPLGSGYDSFTVDSAGNVAVGGAANGPFKLGSFESDGQVSPWFCKFDTNGNLLWGRRVASQITAPYPGASCQSIALDGSGNVIASGAIAWSDSSDFGGTTVYPGPDGESYVAKYNPNGELLWVLLGFWWSMRVDTHGDIYVSFFGSFSGPGQSGIAKLNGNGDLLWQKNFPVDEARGLALDEQGQPVFNGSFHGTAQLDTITLRSRGSEDFFVAKADANGNVLWAIAGGGPNYDEGKDVACDTSGNTFLIATISPGSPGQFDGISIAPIPTEIYETWVVARLSERPPLQMAPSAAGVQLSWPAKATNYVLEAATNLAPGSIWNPVTNTPTVVGRQRTLSVDTNAPVQFFRLHKP